MKTLILPHALEVSSKGLQKKPSCPFTMTCSSGYRMAPRPQVHVIVLEFFRVETVSRSGGL